MNLTDKRFTDPEAARKYLEAQRWPDGPVCSHCGTFGGTPLRGKAHRPGLYQCNETKCREQFTVTTGSVMERSKIPLNKWLLAMHLMGSSKKGYSAHQLHRTLGIGYQAAWFLAHRIREAMMDTNAGPIGGDGKIVEADETYFGDKDTITTRTIRGKSGHSSKRSVFALVERGGETRMFHVEHATAEGIREIIVQNASRKSALHTDESKLYTETGKEFADHRTVKHSAGEYVRKEMTANADLSEFYFTKVHSNTVENVFSVFKRGMKGIYQHCGEAHLHRYVSEFEFRYNRRSGLGIEDTERVSQLIRGTGGKRLTYRIPR